MRFFYGCQIRWRFCLFRWTFLSDSILGQKFVRKAKFFHKSRCHLLLAIQMPLFVATFRFNSVWRNFFLRLLIDGWFQFNFLCGWFWFMVRARFDLGFSRSVAILKGVVWSLFRVGLWFGYSCLWSTPKGSSVGVKAGPWSGCSNCLPFFFCKFSHKISLVTCPCAFPLHKLAQSLRREFSLIFVYGIFPDNSRIKCLLWHFDAHFDWASSHKTVVAALACGILLPNLA